MLVVFYCFMKSISSLFCSWLIVPFRDNGRLTANQKKFNKAHSSLRQTVELLKGRWRKLLYLDHLDVKVMAKLIMAACVLHNFCLMLDDYDNSYFLPGDGNNADDGDGALSAIQQQRIAERKGNHIILWMFSACKQWIVWLSVHKCIIQTISKAHFKNM